MDLDSRSTACGNDGGAVDLDSRSTAFENDDGAVDLDSRSTACGNDGGTVDPLPAQLYAGTTMERISEPLSFCYNHRVRSYKIYLRRGEPV